jgi:hypothetical protein
MDPRPGFRLRALVDFFDRLREAAQKAELAIIRSVGSTVVCKQVCVQHFEAAKAPPPAAGNCLLSLGNVQTNRPADVSRGS